MVMEYSSGLTEENIEVHGKMENNMVKEYIRVPIIFRDRVNGNRVKELDGSLKTLRINRNEKYKLIMKS